MLDRPRDLHATYSAFISYAHADATDASRIASRLERYRLPRVIARRLGHRRLQPVFRDRDELGAAADLGEVIQDAIARSSHLIVVCSAHTPASKWVGREIALFRALHGDDHILTARIAGAGECLHEALLHRADGRTIEPLAADFTKTGDGPRMALLKLVAALAEVPLAELIHRDAQRRLRSWLLAAAMAVMVVAAATFAALVIRAARADASAARQRGNEAMQYQLRQLRAAAKARGSLQLAETVNAGVERFFRNGDTSALSVADRLQFAELRQARAEDEEKRGNIPAAAGFANSAFVDTAALLHSLPTDSRVLFRHAQSAYWVGLMAWRSGEITRADRSFRLYAALADTLVAREPANPDWRIEQGYANSNLGMLALRERRDWPLARHRFAVSQAAFGAAKVRRPKDPDIDYQLEDGEAWLADVDRLAGDLAGARRHREEQRRILTGLMARDRDNALYRTDLIANQLGMARLTAAEGRLHPALLQLEHTRADAAALAASDPGNASVARQARAVELFEAETLLAIPARERPQRPAIDGLLGCDRDWRVTHGEELATFCTLLAARHALERGQRDVARAQLADPRVKAATRAPALSQRWRLNFAAERTRLERAMGHITEGTRR